MANEHAPGKTLYRMTSPQIDASVNEGAPPRKDDAPRQNAEFQDLTPRIAGIARRFRLADIYLFGSRAREIAAKLRGEGYEEEQPAADVDIGIRALQGVRLSPGELVEITIELEELFDVKRVDLVLLAGADPFLALNVIRGELIYAEDGAGQARYELYVLRRAGDLFPFKKARMEMIMEGDGR